MYPTDPMEKLVKLSVKNLLVSQEKLLGFHLRRYLGKKFDQIWS